jgi:hypothetical protein
MHQPRQETWDEWAERYYTEQGRLKGRREGQVEALRKVLLRLGSPKYGLPGTDIEAALAGITDVERLESMVNRLGKATSWQELLDTP